MNNIANDLLTVDKDRTYEVDVKDFMKVLERRAKIPEYLKQNNGDLLYEIVGGYTHEERVDYRGFIDELKTFNYEQAMSGVVPEKPPLHEEPRRRTIFEDDYVVLDSQKIPPNVLDQIESRMAKVGRYLKRHFGSEKNMDQALREAVELKDKNDNVSVDDLKQFVLQSCKDQLIHKKLAKKDIEAFLSAFVYNAYGATSMDSVAKLVFTNENYVAKQLSRKTRPNPPPDEVNAEIRQEIEAASVQDNESATPRKSLTVDYKRAAAVLKEIEDKVYCGGLPRGGTF